MPGIPPVCALQAEPERPREGPVVACVTAEVRERARVFFFFFDSLARVTPPVLPTATVSSNVAYIVAVDVFLIKRLR